MSSAGVTFQVSISVVGVSGEGFFDESWLRNAVSEPLEEGGIDLTE